MPELVALKTEHYECIVSARGVGKSLNQLRQTMLQRGKALPGSSIRLSPPIKLLTEDMLLKEYVLETPVFLKTNNMSLSLYLIPN